MKKTLIIVITIILGGCFVYFLNPIIFSFFKAKSVYPTILIKTCPKGYSYQFDMSTGKNNKKLCTINLNQCKPQEIWLTKKGDCTPDMVGCLFNQPCICDNWQKNNNNWICDN